MKRFITVLALAALMAVMLVAMAAPAFAGRGGNGVGVSPTGDTGYGYVGNRGQHCGSAICPNTGP